MLFIKQHPLLQAELGTCAAPTAFKFLMQIPQTISETENPEEQAHCTQPVKLIFEDLTEKNPSDIQQEQSRLMGFFLLFYQSTYLEF